LKKKPSNFTSIFCYFLLFSSSLFPSQIFRVRNTLISAWKLNVIVWKESNNHWPLNLTLRDFFCKNQRCWEPTRKKKVDLVKKGWLCELKEKKGQRNFFSRNCCYFKNWPWISSEKSSGYKEKISLCMKLMSAFSMKEKPFWLVDKGSWSTFQYLVLFPSSIFLRLNFFLDLYSSVVRFGKVWKTKRKQPELAFISL